MLLDRQKAVLPVYEMESWLKDNFHEVAITAVDPYLFGSLCFVSSGTEGILAGGLILYSFAVNGE